MNCFYRIEISKTKFRFPAVPPLAEQYAGDKIGKFRCNPRVCPAKGLGYGARREDSAERISEAYLVKVS